MMGLLCWQYGRKQTNGGREGIRGAGNGTKDLNIAEVITDAVFETISTRYYGIGISDAT